MAKRRIKKRSKKPASVSSQKQGIIININSHNRKPVPKIVNNKPVPTPSSYPWGAKIITSSQPTVSLKDISDTIKSVFLSNFLSTCFQKKSTSDNSIFSQKKVHQVKP